MKTTIDQLKLIAYDAMFLEALLGSPKVAHMIALRNHQEHPQGNSIEELRSALAGQTRAKKMPFEVQMTAHLSPRCQL